MEVDARAVNSKDIRLRTSNEVQAMSAEARLPALPTSQADIVFPPNIQRLPIYSIMHGQVMTDEQLETLRRQISVYATICQQLVAMHTAIMAQQNAIPGQRPGQMIPFDSVIHTAGQKLTSRQRWTPSQTQLQILESLFEQGSGTPNKQRIKEITAELNHHGPISETNVYNWFQNRRARTKRKQHPGLYSNGESEVDTDVDSPKEKKAKMEKDPLHESFGPGQSEMMFQSLEGALAMQDEESHQFDAQKVLSSAKMHVPIDMNPKVPFNRTVSTAGEHGFAPSSLQDSLRENDFEEYG